LVFWLKRGDLEMGSDKGGWWYLGLR
jgi:hypothetical protein